MLWENPTEPKICANVRERVLIAMRASDPWPLGYCKDKWDPTVSESFPEKWEQLPLRNLESCLRGSGSHGTILEKPRTTTHFHWGTNYRVLNFIYSLEKPSSSVVLVSQSQKKWGEALICTVCWFLWCKYPHHNQLEVTSVMSPNKELKRNAHYQLSEARIN